jgi:hypothetical protein
MQRRANGTVQRGETRIARPQPDVLALSGMGRAAHGGVPVIARAAVLAGCLAAGLSALLHGYGSDLMTARPSVTVMMADLLVMPKPRLQLASGPVAERIAPLREPVHDLDTGSDRRRQRRG